MPLHLFDSSLRAIRRDRAFRQGPELFLYERAFSDCLERIGLVQRRFVSALLVGCPDPSWRDRLRRLADRVEVAEPGPRFARASAAECVVEDEWCPPPGQYDLCVGVGTLDTVNDLPGALRRLRSACRPDALLLGAMAGGHGLPRLRAAMHAADQLTNSASPHVHPRVEATALAGLLTATGFIMPVVDVDRVTVAYPSLMRLVRDLRRMGATNFLASRSRQPLTRAAYKAAADAFAAAGTDGRTIETFEILHFAGWTPPAKADHG